MSPFTCRQAARYIRQGKVVAYPTEAVYGLGCDPLNAHAVSRILEIKQRPVSKGLILIAANLNQLAPFIAEVNDKQVEAARNSWPGPHTWIFPADPDIPYWLSGDHAGIAVRVTNHPVARALCIAANSALVSTSANRSRHSPARSALQCRIKCPETDFIINGEVDKKAQPSVIKDLLTGTVIRA